MATETRVGDWQCPNQECINHTQFPGFFVYGSKVNCPRCGTGKSAQRPGDWCCPNPQCVNHQNTVYSTKTQCTRCGAPRPPLNAKGTAVPNELATMVGEQPAFGEQKSGRLGDWHCPNMSCKNFTDNVVYANKTNCPICGTEKPPPPEGPPPPPKQPPPAAAPAAPAGPPGQHIREPIPGARPGDWHCPNEACKNHTGNVVYGSKSYCPLCGTDKPVDAAPVAPPAPVHVTPPPPPVRGVTPPSNIGGCSMGGCQGPVPGPVQAPNARPGDWHCPNESCKNHTGNVVFGSKSFCPLCGMPKPEEAKPPPPPAAQAPPPPPRTPHPGFADAGATGCCGGACDPTGALGALYAGACGFGGLGGCGACAAPCFGGCGGCGGFGACNPCFGGCGAAVAAAAAAAGCGGCGAFGCGGCGGCQGQMGGRPAPQPGDWHCPNPACKNATHNVVFGSKSTCPICGTPKPGMGMAAAMGAQDMSAFGMAVPAQTNGRPGDWQCPNSACKNHTNGVYASKSHCTICGTPNPNPGGIRSRSRSPHGGFT